MPAFALRECVLLNPAGGEHPIKQIFVKAMHLSGAQHHFTFWQ